MPFYGYNRQGAKISEGIREHWWLQGMLGGIKAHYDCIKAFSETYFTEDLKKIDIPVLVNDDQIVPIVAQSWMLAHSSCAASWNTRRSGKAACLSLCRHRIPVASAQIVDTRPQRIASRERNSIAYRADSLPMRTGSAP
jgi:hypothetical protein